MNRIPLFFLLALWFGCTPEVKVPQEMIDQERMARIMAELLVAEDVTRLKGLQADSSEVIFHGHYKPQIMKKYGTSVAQFDSSLRFYLSNSVVFKEVAKRSEELLKAKVDSLQNPQSVRPY